MAANGTGTTSEAVHVVGWDGETAIATGRLVLPPGSLPTEDVCGIIVEPHGHVADVGRMTVARSHQGRRASAYSWRCWRGSISKSGPAASRWPAA